MKWRFWRFWSKREFMEAGELARLVHSRWLSDALVSKKPYPRIPIKAVDEGGFAPLMSRPNGQARADLWWQRAFDKIDELDGRVPSDKERAFPPLRDDEEPFG